MLILGGAAVITALTGMNLYAVSLSVLACQRKTSISIALLQTHPDGNSRGSIIASI